MQPLQIGSTGTDVAKLQTSLQAAGYSPGAIDSNFGPKTAAALSAYQTANGLKADSIFGPITSAKLYGTGGTSSGIPLVTNVNQPLGSAPLISSNGQSPLSLAQNIDQGGSSTSDNPPPPPPPVVGTSDSARADALQKIKDEMDAGLGAAPAPYNSVDTYNKLRTEQGVVQDEGEMSAIQNEKAQLQEQLRVFNQTAGEGTSEAGRIGMESEAQRNVQNKLDSLAIQENSVTNRLNTKNNYINTVLNLGKEDYQTALNNYNTAYNTNLKAIDLYNTTLSNTQKDALTGFTTITNLLKDHNVSSIDDSTKSSLDSLALQAGLPKGIFQAVIQATPNDKILSPQIVSNTDGTKDVYFYTQDKNGIPSLKTVQRIGGNGTGQSQTTKQAKPAISKTLKTGIAPSGEKIGNAMGSDGYVDPGVYLAAFKAWPGTSKEFIAAFPPKNYVNPASYNQLPNAIRPVNKRTL